ncbi:MAG TPA: phosphoribosylglycinamide formyltransferase [Lachnospiraceae bacterium]|nr:phosphoribosylglycinamide formyltransferase [Lachnospiraceae bacterium]
MLKIGALVSGGGTNLEAIINSTENGSVPNAKVVTVISSKEGTYALERAKKHNINGVCIKKTDFSDFDQYMQAMIDHLESFEVDLVVLAGFMTVIGEKFLEKYKDRIINIHPSLIPSFCGNGFYGIKVHEAALEKGVKVTGATVHFVNEETDGGPIILQKVVYIEENDTAQSLQQRVMEEAEWKIFPEAIKLISEGKIEVVGNKVRRKN